MGLISRVSSRTYRILTNTKIMQKADNPNKTKLSSLKQNEADIDFNVTQTPVQSTPRIDSPNQNINEKPRKFYTAKDSIDVQNIRMCQSLMNKTVIDSSSQQNQIK